MLLCWILQEGTDTKLECVRLLFGRRGPGIQETAALESSLSASGTAQVKQQR